MNAGRTGIPFQGTAEAAFTAFVEQHERVLREALTASFGVDAGRDATADALAHAWERWDHLQVMDNPVGYLTRDGAVTAWDYAPDTGWIGS